MRPRAPTGSAPPESTAPPASGAAEPNGEPTTGLFDPEAPRAPAPEGMLSLSDASFEELRDISLSVTQAKRVIRYREENDGFRDVSELDRVPGFPTAFLTHMKDDVVP